MSEQQTDKPPSERHKIADRLAKFISDNHLAEIYGGVAVKSDATKRKPYAVGFSKARILDGSILVYGPKFINVGYVTAIRALPHKETRVFTSVDDAEKFLRLAFVEHKFDEALAVPVK